MYRTFTYRSGKDEVYTCVYCNDRFVSETIKTLAKKSVGETTSH